MISVGRFCGESNMDLCNLLKDEFVGQTEASATSNSDGD